VICTGITALGRCGNVAKYRLQDTAGGTLRLSCGVHLAQQTRLFVDDWNLAVEVRRVDE
jgi:hypothetical protein